MPSVGFAETTLLKFGFDFRNVGENGPDNFNTRRQVTTDSVFQFGSDFGFTNIRLFPVKESRSRMRRWRCGVL